MGVEYYLICGECKEYIDLHKIRSFYNIATAEKPPLPSDYVNSELYYWEARAVWFLYKHRSHKDVEFLNDAGERFYELEPYLKEVFKYHEY